MQSTQHKAKTAVEDQPTVQTEAAAITACRVCHNTTLTFVLSLGTQAVSDFVTTDTEATAAPLELVLCDRSQGGCGLLQLRHTADQNHLYRNYWYRSGINQTMRDALSNITEQAERLVPLENRDVVLDIGSNDNTLLKSYRTGGIQRVGFEPAVNLMEYAADKDIAVVNDFFSAEPFLKLSEGRKAKITTSIAMFYDLDDPNAFTADVADSLADDGLWIIQMAYLPVMLTNNIFDNICHEHLEYYSLLSLESLLRRHNLKIIDVECNDVNGGSYRTYITHDANRSVKPFPGAAERLKTLREQETAMGLDHLGPYQAFAGRVEQIKQAVVGFVRGEVAKGKSVYVYGASTKGNTLLQYFGLDHRLITAAAERNPDKWGTKTVATHIPIISEEEARAAQPDYFLVLPWHFLSEFQQRERAFLKRGGKFIVPLPTFQVVGLEG